MSELDASPFDEIARSKGYVRLFEDCKTCDGQGTLTEGESWGPSECPDCIDGKVLREGVTEITVFMDQSGSFHVDQTVTDGVAFLFPASMLET